MVNKKGFGYRLELKKLSKTQFMIIVFASCLIIYALGVITNFFSLPIFSAFFIVSKEMAHNIAYVAIGVGVALLTVTPALSSPLSSPKTKEDVPVGVTLLTATPALSPPLSSPETKEEPIIIGGTSLPGQEVQEEQPISQVDELKALIDFLVKLIDFQFDILIDLYSGRFDWQNLKSRLQGFGVNYSFLGKSIPSLSIDLSNIVLAVSSEKPREISKWVYHTLTLIFGYVNALHSEEQESDANLRESKDVILAYLYLNYFWLGKATKEGSLEKEKRTLYVVLQRMISRYKRLFTELLEIIEAPSQRDVETALITSRGLFLEELRRDQEHMSIKDAIKSASEEET